MSDKVQKIKEEIERRLQLLRNGDADTEVMKRVDGVIKAYNSMLQFIDSLPEEPESEDLEEEVDRYLDLADLKTECIGITSAQDYFDDITKTAHHFAEWQKQQMKEALQTEYEKGRFDKREEMMNDAVDATIFSELKGSDGSLFQAKSDRFRMNDVKISDRIKVVPIKIEQQ